MGARPTVWLLRSAGAHDRLFTATRTPFQTTGVIIAV
jgi:hypothetical protein